MQFVAAVFALHSQQQAAAGCACPASPEAGWVLVLSCTVLCRFATADHMRVPPLCSHSHPVSNIAVLMACVASVPLLGKPLANHPCRHMAVRAPCRMSIWVRSELHLRQEVLVVGLCHGLPNGGRPPCVVLNGGQVADPHQGPLRGAAGPPLQRLHACDSIAWAGWL